MIGQQQERAGNSGCDLDSRRLVNGRKEWV
jgi:hypothetical protein